MWFFKLLSIKRKLIWISLGASSVALTLAGTALGINYLMLGKRSLLNSLSAQANIIGANSAAALVFNDQLSARQTLSALSAQSPVVAAGIYTQDNVLFARYPQGGNNDKILPLRLFDDNQQYRQDYLQVIRPIALDGEKIGSVFLIADLEELYSQLVKQVAIIALVLLMSLLVALIMSARMQRLISEPILRLAETAKVVSRTKNYTLRVKKQSQDELGTLTEAFNDMLVQIQDQDTKLNQHKADLEELVARRTVELHELNNQLKNQAHDLEELVSARTAELHMLNEQLRHQAYHDTLTNLPNRALFNDRLSQAILHAQRSGRSLAVLFLDLDRFKNINDTLGHAVGDQLLYRVACRLRQCVRREDTVARLGGDEFTILLGSLTCAQDARELAKNIVKSLAHPFNCYGHDLHITTSIGIAVYPNDGNDTETLMRNADTAMYCTKARGRNNYGFYVAAMHTNSLNRLEMENHLRRALIHEDFVVYYQPQCDIQSGRIVAVEALLRCRHQELGLVSPAVFVPILEETGLILPVGEWVLRNACTQASAWKEAGLTPVKMTVNCSSHQFNQHNLGDKVMQILAESGLSPSSLTLEITESLLMENAEHTVRTLQELSTMGIHLAIDDFGTGYSSLNYLKRFPINTIKIDKTFVHDITTDQDDAAIVKAIIAMAHALGLEVTAEGVETKAQLDFLRGYRCDTVQGYLLGKPLSNEKIISKLALH
jgi:diguanylate cyclase (GGDEF)-like protein